MKANRDQWHELKVHDGQIERNRSAMKLKSVLVMWEIFHQIDCSDRAVLLVHTHPYA